jgi:ketosteroid isomerase-like protein
MENAADNELLIRQIVENWAKAVRDENMNGILANHADDIIMFDVPEPFQSIGIDAYRKTWDIFFKYTRPGIFDIQQLSIVAGENVAFCIATMKCLDKSDGGDFKPLDFRLTIGLKKINDQWMVVHEHHSVPAS